MTRTQMDRNPPIIIDMQPDGSFAPVPKPSLGTVLLRLGAVATFLLLGIALLWTALISSAVIVLGGLALYGFWRIRQLPLIQRLRAKF